MASDMTTCLPSDNLLQNITDHNAPQWSLIAQTVTHIHVHSYTHMYVLIISTKIICMHDNNCSKKTRRGIRPAHGWLEMG